MRAYYKLCLTILLCSIGPKLSANESVVQTWVDEISFPASIRVLIEREYNFTGQDGSACNVSLAERVLPGQTYIGDGEIIIPYQCLRSHHSYSCGGAPRNRAAQNAANYYGKIVVEYEVIDSLLRVTNIRNPNNSNETECGRLIVEYVKSISVESIE